VKGMAAFVRATVAGVPIAAFFAIAAAYRRVTMLTCRAAVSPVPCQPRECTQ
jgi:hypothetical protein